MKNFHQLNQQGFFPGPGESQENFYKRVIYCQNIKKELNKNLPKDFPFDEKNQHSETILKEAFAETQRLYGIAPDWVPLYFNNFELPLWQGGCAWIFQIEDESPKTALIQLRSFFQHQKTYLGLYQRNELLAHELAHVGRMMYNEPKFEEFFAYCSSHSPFRRWVGPIFQSSKETLLFLFVLMAVVFSNLPFFVGLPYLWWLILQWFLLLLLLLGMGRLAWRHWLLNRCLKHLAILTQDPQVAQHLLYRLKDTEIYDFAFLSPKEIREWILKKEKSSFRWLFLNTNYPLKYDE